MAERHRSLPPAVRRSAELVRNVSLLAATAARHLTDDPLLLVVQTARRMPGTWRMPLARVAALGTRADRPTVRRAFAEFLADRPARAAAVLERCARPRTRVGHRVWAELAVQLSLPLPTTAGPGPQARAAWHQGDISGAIAHAERGARSRSYAKRLDSERQAMQAGFRLSPSVTRGSVVAQSVDSAPRILHVLTNSVPHTHSGYAIRSHSILTAQWAAGLDARAITRIGYPVTVGRVNARTLEVVDSVSYRRVLPARLAGLPTTRLQQMVDAASSAAATFAPHVLHTTTNYTNALVTEAMARSLNVPWVYEVRGMLEETWLASRPPSVRDEARASERYALLRAKETEMMLAADHVVVLSEVSRREISGRGVPEDRISVVPNAIDEELLSKQLNPREARARLGLPLDGFWVGSVSSLVDYEGFDVLLRAVAILRTAGHDVRALLVGDGVSRPALVQLAADLGISDAVTLPGRVGRDSAWLWHRVLNTFVVPRRDLQVCREVTPLKPIEAMAAGRPVIASDLPALREIVVAPLTGEVVPPERPEALALAVARLLDSPTLRDRYGSAGRSFAASRTWQQSAEIYRKVYQHVGVSA